jgi:hypothetical protein
MYHQTPSTTVRETLTILRIFPDLDFEHTRAPFAVKELRQFLFSIVNSVLSSPACVKSPLNNDDSRTR